MIVRKRDLWARDGLYVWATLDHRGALTIEGQDLSGPGEYEYAMWLTVEQTKLVAEALDTARPRLLKALVAAYPQIHQQGELNWLRSLGVEPQFWSRHED